MEITRKPTIPEIYGAIIRILNSSRDFFNGSILLRQFRFDDSNDKDFSIFSI